MRVYICILHIQLHTYSIYICQCLRCCDFALGSPLDFTLYTGEFPVSQLSAAVPARPGGHPERSVGLLVLPHQHKAFICWECQWMCV